MPEPNRSRRATDTVETIAGRTLAVLMLVAVGMAVAVGLAVHAEVDRQASVQARTRAPITAELTEDLHGFVPQGVVRPRVPADVRWIAADGAERRHEAMVEQGQATGAAVTIWLDSRGDPVGTPVTSSDAVVCGIVAGVTVIGLAALALALAWWLVRRAIFALNARGWAEEWAAVEPLWRRELR